ncbi:MAG TPA: small ribosomal subunit Rsm22 family protein [Bdellovibrionales bacterium]|nr:small ribosomal subunit Rsm22 family protein [Bdellovibrionales bacterium]
MSPSEPERTESRQYSFPQEFEPQIEALLSGLGYSLSKPGALAEAVRKLSGYYIQNQSGATPWHERWAQAAYLAYFFPLNWARSQAVCDEGRRAGFFNELDSFIDFGSGLSAYSFLLDNFKAGIFVEPGDEARRLHQRLVEETAGDANLRTGSPSYEWHPRVRLIDQTNRLLGVFSYVLTELPSLPQWGFDVEALLIVEPSTRDDGRRLQELRGQLIDRGFYPWAPCTHAHACPLLVHSKHDWCHDRIHFEQPAWFEEIEKLLPMKNRTITFSYLLMRKTKPPHMARTHRSQAPEAEGPAGLIASPAPETIVGDAVLARLVGDQLEEKGKTRQLVCQGPERQFLSWLHRNGPLPGLKRGHLVQMPEKQDQRGNEIRVGPESHVALVRKYPLSY